MNELHPIFQDCCGIEAAMSKPFRVDSHVYATDGHILVTSLDVEEMEHDARVFACEVARTYTHLSKTKYESTPTPIPVFKVPGESCSRCEGTGEMTCDLGHKHDCLRCDGTGEVNKVVTIRLRNDVLGIGSEYLKILWRHEAALFAPCDKSGTHYCFRFTIPETTIEGYVMPRE